MIQKIKKFKEGQKVPNGAIFLNSHTYGKNKDGTFKQVYFYFLVEEKDNK